jgi:hypothetical protein
LRRLARRPLELPVESSPEPPGSPSKLRVA